MSPCVRESITIEAAPQDVWEVVMDPCRLGEWVGAHREAREVPPGELEQGDSFEQRLCMAGKSFDVRWKLVRSDAPRLAVWEADGPRRTHADVRYELVGDGDATRFDYVNEFDLPGGPLRVVAGGFASAPARRQARKSLQKLKRLVESA